MSIHLPLQELGLIYPQGVWRSLPLAGRDREGGDT